MKYLTSVWLTLLFLASSVPLQAETDWTYWRGPRFDSVSAEKNLPDSWDPAGGEGSNVLWKQPIGTRSTPIIMQGRLYALTTDNPEVPQKTREKVVCLNAETGELIWEYAFNVYLSDVPAERVGWSSVVGDPETGNVYALGVCGYFCCLNGETGEVQWDRSLHEEFGLLSTYGGRTNFPLIHENNVIISSVVIGWGEMAKPAHRFIAFDKTNGQSVWFEGTRLFPHDTTYSAPVLAVIGGELQMVFGSGDGGVYGFQPRTGKKLWSYDLSGRGINASPLVVGDKVICGHSEENLDSVSMGALVCLDATKRGKLDETGVLWKSNELTVGRSSPVVIDGRLYAADDRAKLWCLDLDTGKPLGKEVRMGTMMRANLLYADGKIFAHEVNGRAYILKPTETGAEIVHQLRVRNEEFHGSPIAWKGRVYIPSTSTMYCIGKADVEPSNVDLPAAAVEPPRDTDMTPAQAQLVPVESLLHPGTRQEFHVRLYNAKGQYIRNANPEEIQFTLNGPGEITNSRYTIGRSQSEQAPVLVEAKVGELTAKARIRVIPDLPWSYNFDGGNIPMTWVGVQYRHVGLDFDLLSKLRGEDKRAADLYLYLHTAFTNYGPAPKSFADTTPKQDWTALLRFLKLSDAADKPKTVAEAQEKLGASLQKLVDEKVLASVEWSTWERPTGDGDKTVAEPKLTVSKGERKIDGNGVLCKISTIPLGTRSQGWTGHPDFHDYTVQSDVYTLDRDGKLSDIGLVAQRYTLDMMGASQKLQLRTWTPQLNRFSVDVPFEWQAETWYTMKFQAATDGGKAILKGKVWKRGEPEPTEWTITGEDELGNTQGSPGFFGNAKDAEIFYDNLTVTPN